MAVELSTIPIAAVDWAPCFRIIPSRYPPKNLFERVTDEADLDVVFAIESLTNDRLRDQRGEIRLIPEKDRRPGIDLAYVMAPFTHFYPGGSRFTDGTFGAFYAARDLDTAIDETVYHRERFLAATSEEPIEVEMRVLRVRLKEDLHDIRGLRASYPELYHPDDYSDSQRLGRAVRDAGGGGIIYESVRRPGGEAAAVFRPRAILRCQQAQHLAYVWDGARISAVYQKRVLRDSGDQARKVRRKG